MPVPRQAEDLDAEPVQAGDAAGVQGGDDLVGFGGGLAAAYRPEPDQGFGSQVDPGRGVQVSCGVSRLSACEATCSRPMAQTDVVVGSGGLTGGTSIDCGRA